MAKKSGGQIAGELAHLGKSLYDIIKAFMQGGWGAAAVQALKHYWPQIIAIAVALILIPIIVFCCLPMMLFGFESSTDTEIASMTQQATTVSACYDQYEAYIDAYVSEIQSTVMASGVPNTEINGSTDSSAPEPIVEYEVVISGSKIQKNWFVALHSVTVGNNLNAATEADIRAFSRKCVDYTVTRVVEETTPPPPTEPPDSSGATEPPAPEVIKMLLEIRYLTPTEIMASCGYTASDENWSRLIHKTLEMENNSSVGVLGSLFSDASWRSHITSNYGYRTSPYSGFHYGIDIGMPMGTPICATKDGTVSSAIYSTSGYGYHIIIDHGNGVQTLYAHCSELLVSTGATVTKGQVIAKVGSTGNSTGPHCHFEVRINGERVDPSPYLP